jgi:hypothetical protein
MVATPVAITARTVSQRLWDLKKGHSPIQKPTCPARAAPNLGSLSSVGIV